jgi:hypothetical protein
LFGRTPARRPDGPAREASVGDLLADWNLTAAQLAAIRPGPVISVGLNTHSALRRDPG